MLGRKCFDQYCDLSRREERAGLAKNGLHITRKGVGRKKKFCKCRGQRVLGGINALSSV